ncbi:Beta-1,4-glucuronyltransferase 1 [Armadillidium nasatum]|uniref:Beta-1,4-glucuronyltransferase 1 n=1 Tax=Armadillidium nasatum TaxID=96803 RepID=A0A5N5SMJ5_9CRUS|nr:Beta-1,4-glucuronyltransferase 1 [Armadillidium nasatum]
MTPVRLILVRSSVILNAILICYLFISWQFATPVHRINVVENDEGSSNVMAKRHPLGQLMANENAKSDLEKASEREGKGEVIEVKKDEKVASVLEKDTEVKNHEKLNGEIPNENYIISKPEETKKSAGDEKQKSIVEVSKTEVKEAPKPESPPAAEEYEEPPRDVQERAGVSENPAPVASLPEEAPDPPLDSLERKMYPNLRDCHTRPIIQQYIQKGDYWVLENYIPAALNFRCDESITYTTHADYTFLDNLDPLTSRWQGPVSIAVYSPGTDFQATVDTILYLRSCMAEGIKKYVTFHIFFHINHVPKEIPKTEDLLQRKTDCSKDPPRWTNVTTYRMQKKMLYPVNVARNVARGNSITYFNFPSDIELYPSVNVITEFFAMLKKPDASKTTNPRVFVFPIFEVADNENVPETKAELQAMLKTKKAIPFHKFVCPKCHAQPKSPMYIMCVRDYEFHILDNAFLVHRPGIKKYAKDKTRDKIAAKQSYIIRTKIFPEYKTLFGSLKDCII